ncbi:MAG: bifunctional 4-hydroxy-2-oxoglutarate aldolase/2-dehydro-3-deoxy-phosphogluconate aldolase [Propionibacteriaceae bacterium]
MISSLLDVSRVIPVVTIDDPDHAVPVARALLAGGIPVIELTLRTPTAAESLSRIAQEVPEILVGAGTVITAAQADDAVARGAQFLVSPGVSPGLLRHFLGLPVPFLPGVATVGEMLTVLDAGVTELKFFPAGPAGGPSYLAAVAAPVPQVRFCPTGGVTPQNMSDYLALPNVGCVGGSWLTPRDLLAEHRWDEVARLAAAAVAD